MAAEPNLAKLEVPWSVLLRFLARAFVLRHRPAGVLSLPAAAPRTNPPAAVLAAFRRTLLVIRLLTFWNFRVCFYRSYAAAMAGRQLGLNVQVHFGVRAPGEKSCRAHSWISIRGIVVGESRPPRTIYPLLLGRTGDVVYWMAAPASGPCPVAPTPSATPPAGSARIKVKFARKV